VLGVGALGVGVVGDGWLDWLSSEPDVPPDPSEPLLPSSGHGAPSWLRPSPRDVSVDPPEDGSLVAPGAVLADGSGLAAATIATPPVTSSAAAMPAVRTARRNPIGSVPAVRGFVAWSGPGGPIAGPADWSSQVMRYSFVCLIEWGALSGGDQVIASSLRAWP
jgi:hypothetical protein